MLQARMHAALARRRGIILLVVVALLTLFAIVGLTFVLYAEGEAKASRMFRDAQSSVQPDVDPEQLLSYFLGQLIYDVPDPALGTEWGAYSALRGHSLARLMYGADDNPNNPNDKPFIGVGRLHTFSSNPVTYTRYPCMNPYGQDDYNLVNYQFFLSDGFLRDPERVGPLDPAGTWFQLLGTPPQGSYRTGIPGARGPYLGGANVPYTYPDLNNMFLAAVRADGAVLMPSFHRPWTGFVPATVPPGVPQPVTGLEPTNPNWLVSGVLGTPGADPSLKYRILRPRPPEHTPSLPLPEDAGGDVKNLATSPGTLFWNGTGWAFANNDSIWLDLGHPVITGADGRRYKPLFAPLIIDLDNRVNVNVHGNVKKAITQPGLPEVETHASNQGWGPWEVSLRYALSFDTMPTPAGMGANDADPATGVMNWRAEWSNLFLGAPVPDPQAYGVPTSIPKLPGGVIPPMPGLTKLQHLGKYGGTPWTNSMLVAATAVPGTQANPPASWNLPYPCPSFPSGGALAGTFYDMTRPDAAPHFYARVDFDAVQNSPMQPPRQTSGQMQVQMLPLNGCFPGIPNGYDNGTNTASATSNWLSEVTDHPLLYNVFQPIAYSGINPPDDRTYGLTNLEALLRYGDTNAPGLTTTLFRLCPQNFSDTTPFTPTTIDSRLTGLPPYTTLGARRRNLLTTHSFDVDRPGVIPYIFDPTAAPYALSVPADAMVTSAPPPSNVTTTPVQYPVGAAIPFQQPTGQNNPAVPQPPSTSEYSYSAAPGVPAGGYRGSGGGILAYLSRLDLNRSLPNYPLPNATGFIDLSQPPIAAQFNVAQKARQDLAVDIYNVLRAVTGAGDPNVIGKGQPGYVTDNGVQFYALRWLAQLAVNIVDYIDSDDIITPFNWYTEPPPTATPPGTGSRHWVYGTELPRVVLNEAMAAYNVPATGPPTTVKVFVELFNPLNNVDTSLADSGAARLEMPAGAAGAGSPAYAIYRLVACKQYAGFDTATYLSDPQNTRGSLGTQAEVFATNPPDSVPAVSNDIVYDSTVAGKKALVDTWEPNGMGPLAPPSTLTTNPPSLYPGQYQLDPSGNPVAGTTPDPDPRFILPCLNNTVAAPASSNRGYYVVGPDASGGVTPTLQRPELEYQVNPPETQNPPLPPTIVLQRLACPYILPQKDPNAPNYNPYITVDYMPQVTVCNQMGTLQSYGRIQPYVGANNGNTIKLIQQTGAVAGTNNTFFAINSGVSSPFQWLIHLDRQLRSPMELLRVSAFKPTLLTQQFRAVDPVTMQPQFFQHLAPWLDANVPNWTGPTAPTGPASARLYRALEFFATRSRALGLSAPQTAATANILASTGTPLNPVTIQLQQIRGVAPSGVPWSIRDNTVVILDPGKATQENVRVIPGSVNGTTFQAITYLAHTAPCTVMLTSLGDRIPGKININTIWDPETIQALCDPQSSNNFTATNVYSTTAGTPNLFTNLLQWRTPYLNPSNTFTTPATAMLINGFDMPFRGLTPGLAPGTGSMTPPPDPQYPAPVYPSTAGYPMITNGPTTGSSVSNSLLRSSTPAGGAGSTAWFNVTGGTTSSPYLQNEMLDKIASNLTTRSNIFGVWLTVGFFEVLSDPGVMPAKLGAEIGKAENRHVRHRMFAVIDRTNLLLQQTADPATGLPTGPTIGSLAPGIPSVPVLTSLRGIAAGPNSLVRVTALSGTTQFQTSAPSSPTPPLTWRLNWSIQGSPAAAPGTVWGSVLVVDPGTANEEVVVVQQIVNVGGGVGFRAKFTRAHGRNAPISVLYVPGNPGPQQRFDFHGNTGVVPYASIIK